MPVNSHTEWDLLEEVVVGTPKNAHFSFWDPFYKLVYSEEEIAKIERHLKFNQPYPDSYIEAAGQAIYRIAQSVLKLHLRNNAPATQKRTAAKLKPDWTGFADWPGTVPFNERSIQWQKL